MNGSDVSFPPSWKHSVPRSSTQADLCSEEAGVYVGTRGTHGLISSIMYYSVTLELSNFSTKQPRTELRD